MYPAPRSGECYIQDPEAMEAYTREWFEREGYTVFSADTPPTTRGVIVHKSRFDQQMQGGSNWMYRHAGTLKYFIDTAMAKDKDVAPNATVADYFIILDAREQSPMSRYTFIEITMFRRL